MIDISRLVRDDVHLVKLQLVAELHNHWDEIVSLADERASTLGVRDYGDSSLSKSPGELRAERFAEYADAIFYAQAQRRRERLG